jgi:excisionase family DNA binding protein
VKSAPIKPRRWGSVDDAAKHLGVSSKTIRRNIATGKLPAYRTGDRVIRIDLNELESNMLTRIPTGGSDATW